jgi:hypothetical protein
MNARMPRSEPPPELRDRVLEAILQEPIRPRVAGARRRGQTLALGFAAMAAISYGIATPKTWGKPVGYVEGLVVLWTVVASLVTWAAFGRGGSMLGRTLRWRLATVVATPLVLIASWLPIALRWPETLVDASTPFRHFGCVLGTLALASGPFVAFARLRRESDPIAPVLTGATIGTAAASWGAVALLFVCPFTSPAHMLFGHLLPIVGIAALGALVGERFVAVRL